MEYSNALKNQWASKSPQQAHDFLSKPDVTVTNQSDKEGQLGKISKLDETVQGAFQLVFKQQQQQVVEMEQAAASAKEALQAVETPTCKADEEAHRSLQELADRAEAEAAAARKAKQNQHEAIQAGITPMVIERERELLVARAEAARKVCGSCASADDEYIYGCVPLTSTYRLPFCLDLCLCPQQEYAYSEYACHIACEELVIVHTPCALVTGDCAHQTPDLFNWTTKMAWDQRQFWRASPPPLYL